MNRLQSVQNAVARLVTYSTFRPHNATPVLRRLWLPVRQRVDFNQSINQTNNFTWPEYRNYTARSTGDSQVMYSKYSGKDFLNRCVLRRRQNVVNDAADVTSSGRSFHVCGPVTTTRKARLPTVDSLLVGTIPGD